VVRHVKDDYHLLVRHDRYHRPGQRWVPHDLAYVRFPVFFLKIIFKIIWIVPELCRGVVYESPDLVRFVRLQSVQSVTLTSSYGPMGPYEGVPMGPYDDVKMTVP
jgi:hypothetical protein